MLKKQRLLYDEIDRNKFFRGTVINAEDRSLMNATFVMQDEYADLAGEFPCPDQGTQYGRR